MNTAGNPPKELWRSRADYYAKHALDEILLRRGWERASIAVTGHYDEECIHELERLFAVASPHLAMSNSPRL